VNLRVRCPQCTKLYEVQSEDIHSEIPLFQCISCDSRFGFEYSPENLERIETFLVPVNSAAPAQIHSENNNAAPTSAAFTEPTAQETKSCPKCGAINGRKSQECYSCHVIFERLEGLPTDPTLRAQPSLVRKWKNVLADFNNEELHDEFVLGCQQMDALKFASMKYEEIKSAQGGDVMCDIMLAKINSMMNVTLSQNPTAKDQGRVQKIQSVTSLESWIELWNDWKKYAHWAPYMLAAFMVLWGILSLAHRNLVGVGVALACMTSGLMFMIKGRLY